MKTVRCDYCGNPAPLVDSAEFYGGVSYGPVYACRPCKARVGVHKGTDKPLGRLANEQLRKAKVAAHDAFDPLWRKKLKFKSRDKAYAWLANVMGLTRSTCHIGMFDVDQCRRVVEVCAELFEGESGESGESGAFPERMRAAMEVLSAKAEGKG